MDVLNMTFTYFRQPHEFSTYKSEPQTCEVCKMVGLGYSGPFYGEKDIEFVCEECLLSGKLAEVGVFANSGNVRSLREQLEKLHSEFDENQVKDLVERRNSELEHRTPNIVTWQDFEWPAHCGDYCCFIKEVGKPELDSLASNGDGQSFFAEHLIDGGVNIADIWQSIRPDEPKDNTVAYSVGVYLFQCLHCDEYMIFWDCD